MTDRILSGCRVLDFSHVLAGPTATRLMAEMGAEVIKVEFPPLGDVSRILPFICEGGRSAYFTQQNRGKKSLCLNLKTPEGAEIIRGLIRQSDVVIENFAPGVAARLGVGWETVHELNPATVMCSISALGQEGPLSHLPGFDYIAQAYAGVTGMIGDPDGPPALPMLALGDVSTGTHAAAAIGFALLHRERTGRGQHLDISLLDAYYHYHELNVQLYSLTKGEQAPTRAGSHHYAVCPLGLFKGHERYLCIITLEPQWPSLCRAMEREDLIEDPRFRTNADRVANQEEVIALIQGWLAGMPSDEAALKALEKHRVPSAPVLSIGETLTEPHLRQRGTVKTVTDPKLGTFDIPGNPLRFSEFPDPLDLQAAHLGEHNREVLGALLGYDAARIDALEAAEVLYSNPDT